MISLILNVVRYTQIIPCFNSNLDYSVSQVSHMVSQICINIYEALGNTA